MRIRPVIALSAAALAASIMVVPASSDASASSSASDVAVAAGTVTSPSGAAASGVPVDLYAWPSSAVLMAMKPGQIVPRTLLATATTNSSGQYTLNVPAATLKAAVVDSGYANLEIDSAFGIWFTGYQAGAVKAPATVTVNLAGADGNPCGKLPGGRGDYNFSGWTLLKKSPNQIPTAGSVVGQGYIVPSKKTRGDWVRFDYTNGSSHSQASSLGVGISAYGISAGYSSKGTNTSTAKRSEGWPKMTKNALFVTQFNVGEYRAMCGGPPNIKVPRRHQHGYCPKKYVTEYVHECLWMVQSIGWSGGATSTHPTHEPATQGYNCDPQQAGSHFNSDFGAAIEWASKFAVGAALKIKGVNLKTTFGTTTQTGYDTNALLYYQFTRGGYICGTNGEPSSATIVLARPRKT
jgi:hypothetical protein